MNIESKLNGGRLQALLDWLRQHDIRVRNVTREFADGMLMAKLMIKLFPYRKSVYPTAGRHTSVQAKMTFWLLLNKRVLEPAGFGVDHENIERFVYGEPPAMEMYLNHVMQVEGSLQRGKLMEEARQASTSRPADGKWRTAQAARLARLTTYSEYEAMRYEVESLEQTVMAVHLRNVNIEMEMPVKQKQLKVLEDELAMLLEQEQEQKMKH